MKCIDLYSLLKKAAKTPGLKDFEIYEADDELRSLLPLARSWGLNQQSIEEWFASDQARAMEPVARDYLQVAPRAVREIEAAFGRELPGELIWMPSFADFDGFARYDRGEHRVLLGIDFPDASVDYLRALTAHELSHVYRDHAPEVWAHLGKPLREVSRKEYLEASDAREHLVSEGLATLFSQVLYPEISASLHHYYEEAEWQWCVDHHDEIHGSILECLMEDEDVWSFYAPSRVAQGSPSRTHYYWAAKMLSKRIEGAKDPVAAVVELHERPARFFTEFAAAERLLDEGFSEAKDRE